MFTVVIETHNDEEALARSLAALIQAAVEGAVREVIVADRASADHTHKVADQAGCVFLANADIGAAVRRARGEWILLIEPGARMQGEWYETALEHAARSQQPARFSRSRDDSPGLFTRVFSASRPLMDGLIISKRQAQALARSGTTAQALARGLSSRKLPGTIRPAPPKTNSR